MSVPFGIDELLDACPSTFVTFGQLHPTCPSGTILSPHVSHITPLISDWSTLVLGLLFLELPDDWLSRFPGRGEVLLLLTVLDFSEAVLFSFFNFGGLAPNLSSPFGLKQFQRKQSVGQHPFLPHTKHFRSCGKSSGSSITPSLSPWYMFFIQLWLLGPQYTMSFIFCLQVLHLP